MLDWYVLFILTASFKRIGPAGQDFCCSKAYNTQPIQLFKKYLWSWAHFWKWNSGFLLIISCQKLIICPINPKHPVHGSRIAWLLSFCKGNISGILFLSLLQFYWGFFVCFGFLFVLRTLIWFLGIRLVFMWLPVGKML